MKFIRLVFYWSQMIASIAITAVLGLFPLIRSFIDHSDNFYKICFSALVIVGITLLIRPSLTELREAQKK